MPRLQERFFCDLIAPAKGLPAYIGALYSNSEVLGGYIRQKWDKASCIDDWLSSLDAVLSIQPHSINYTPTLRNAANSKDDSVAYATTLWVDIDDYLWSDWKKHQYPLLTGTVFEPTVCVDSGWGVHLYWFLTEYIDLSNKKRRTLFQKAASMLAWMFNADIQSSATLSHLMRLPGSYNCKSAPYYKECKIEYTQRHRVNFEELTTELEEYANEWLQKYTLSPFGGREVNKKVLQIKSIIQAETLSTQNDYSRVFSDKKIYADISELENRLREAARHCPLIDLAVNHPEEIGFAEWMSFGCGLGKKLDPQIAEDLFYKLSLPGNKTPNPDKDIRIQFRKWVERSLMPANCATKLSIGCEKAGSNCNSIMRILNTAFHDLPVSGQRPAARESAAYASKAQINM